LFLPRIAPKFLGRTRAGPDPRRRAYQPRFWNVAIFGEIASKKFGRSAIFPVVHRSTDPPATLNLVGLRLHDLRHSFASYGAGDGLGLPIIGKLLGHSQASTTHRYAHLDADPLRRASEQIAGAITAALDNSSRTQSNELIRES